MKFINWIQSLLFGRSVRVTFTPEGWESLHRMKATEGISTAELIRRALLQYDYELYLEAVQAQGGEGSSEEVSEGN